MRRARSWSTSKVTRSRWFTPTRVAPTARARSSSASSCTSTSASRPTSVAAPWNAASSPSSSAAAMSRTQSAPMIRASRTSCRDTVKSLRSTGTPTAPRAAARSAADPPKCTSSVSTDRQVAPPVSYWAARVPGSRSAKRSPLDGDRRLTSAMTPSPSADRSASANPRAGGAAAAAARSSDSSARVACGCDPVGEQDGVEVGGHGSVTRRAQSGRPLAWTGVQMCSSGAPASSPPSLAPKALNASLPLWACSASPPVYSS